MLPRTDWAERYAGSCSAVLGGWSLTLRLWEREAAGWARLGRRCKRFVASWAGLRRGTRTGIHFGKVRNQIFEKLAVELHCGLSVRRFNVDGRLSFPPRAPAVPVHGTRAGICYEGERNPSLGKAIQERCDLRRMVIREVVQAR